MKEILDWMREQMLKRKSAWEEDSVADKVSAEKHIGTWNVALRILEKAEAKWKEKEAEFRASVIDEFAEAIMVKAIELSEKVVFDGRLVGDALSLDCVSDIVVEIASQMKGEKE